MDIFYPFEIFSHWLVFDLAKFAWGSHLGQAASFFIYDSLKIAALLLVIGYFMAIIRRYLPIEKTRNFLAGRRWYGLDHLFASFFGAITPFCSCSSIPLFVGFLEAGIPLGVTLSFLISSPLVDEAVAIVLVGLFGWKITLIYILSGMILGVIGGMILGKLKLEKYVADYVWQIRSSKKSQEEESLTLLRLLKKFWKDDWQVAKRIIPYALLGVAVGALIHGYVPAGYFEQYITKDNIFAVPIAVLAGVPMYANAIGVIPIVESLVDKGIPLGTALAFMMAIVGLSLPEALILKKVMKLRLLLLFFGVTALCMILIGYFFNLVL